jgi:hypothetical protein
MKMMTVLDVLETTWMESSMETRKFYRNFVFLLAVIYNKSLSVKLATKSCLKVKFNLFV